MFLYYYYAERSEWYGIQAGFIFHYGHIYQVLILTKLCNCEVTT
jgi:hypothetical protein